MLLVIFFRRLSPRARRIVGLTLLVVGLILLALSATVTTAILVHGVITTTLGAVLLASTRHAHRPTRAVLFAGEREVEKPG